LGIVNSPFWCYRKAMQTLTVKVPADLSDWLDKRARELNRPKSEIVREALSSQRLRNNPESVLARAGDLVGKYAGTRHSSHKRNLKRLGSWKRS
jgi:metal-responsive CopG/Arc/MetJ family transcriptional regulator